MMLNSDQINNNYAQSRADFVNAKRALLSLSLGVLSLMTFSIGDAAQRDTQPREMQSGAEEASKPSETSSNKTIVIPDVQGVNIEENMRLRRDLDEYTRTVDPAHVQIEERRRVMHKRLQERFAQIDRDGDGMISREEAIEGIPQLVRHFPAVDLNRDNQLTLEELEALQAKILERQRLITVRIESPQEAESSAKKKSKDLPSARKRAL
jgi:hypothetical protein